MIIQGLIFVFSWGVGSGITWHYWYLKTALFKDPVRTAL